LHEGLAQELAGTLLMLGNLSSILRREAPVGVPLLAEITEQVARSIGAARRMAQDLAPVMVERGSLGDALQWLAVSAESQIRAAVSLDCRIGDCTISDLAADHIYQFCSEAVVNTALSESCHRVKIELQVVMDSLVIRISGDLRTDSTQTSPWDESNTKRMVFRARLLGGVLGFESTAGRVVSATLTVPVAQLQDDVSISAP
jgi:signal transduction histidine kinase